LNHQFSEHSAKYRNNGDTGQESRTSHIDFDNNRLVADLAGEHDAHLSILENAFQVRIDPRGNRFAVSGNQSAIDKTLHVLAALYEQLQNNLPVTTGDIRAAIKMVSTPQSNMNTQSTHTANEEQSERQGMAQPDKNLLRQRNAVSIRTPKRTIIPRTSNQTRYLETLQNHPLVFGTGPAGTGKTYLAVAHAVHQLLSGKVERLILTRPALEAGERIGFLPGDMKEKVDPYLRPLYDALHDMMDTDFVERRLGAGDIEIAPLGFMRGRTLARAIVILDEGQNATTMQMKMFLTRLGEGASMIVTGDASQSDLPHHEVSGLNDAITILSGVEGVGHIEFEAGDVVRHPLVGRIINAYDHHAKPQRHSAAQR